MDTRFWVDVDKLIKILWPLLQLLRLGDSNTPTLFQVYKATKLVRERLSEYEFDDDIDYMEDIIAVFDKYEPDLLSDVAKAAAVIDVKTWAMVFDKDFSECKTAMVEYIEVYCKANKKSAEFLAKAFEGMNKFVNKEGPYAIETMIEKGRSFKPHVFFDMFCGNTPEFAEIAMRLSSKPSASGAAERDHKDTKFVWTKTRNRLTPEKVEMLKHRYCSIRMKYRSEFDEGFQADEEFIKYWDLEDFVDPGGQTIAPTTRTMVGDIQEDAFRAYIEDWEKPLLTINEASDSAARFRLATKYKGMAMWDEALDEWRVVIDLEWSSTRVADDLYGNKKGWVLVCELMQGKHDEEIAKAKDAVEIREAIIINEAAFVDIIAAGNVQTRPVIECPRGNRGALAEKQ